MQSVHWSTVGFISCVPIMILVQRTVVLRIAVVGALRNSALNALIGFGHAAHGLFLLLF